MKEVLWFLIATGIAAVLSVATLLVIRMIFPVHIPEWLGMNREEAAHLVWAAASALYICMGLIAADKIT